MNAFLEQLTKFGIGRLIAIFGLTAGAAAALVIFTSKMNGGGEALLFSGLQPADAATVTQRLDQASISYTLAEGGSAVYVPASQVDEARLRVASQGALGFGSVGYEIFDESDALGTTAFVQNVNAKRALEGELARSINTINTVSASRVHLVLPERRLFSQDQEDPSASVVITTQGRVTQSQVDTIRNLISTAVTGLSPGRITVADDQGRLLASPSGEGESASAAALEDRRESFESDLREKIRDVVSGVVGAGGVRVVVTAQLDRQSLSETSQIYDPDGRVLRSEVSSDITSSDQNNQDGGVSVSENLPQETAQGAGDSGPTQRSQSQEERTTRNFEISRTDRTRIMEAGGLQRLSVAVVVDGITSLNEDGTLNWQPRTDAEMAQIRQLVSSAMGFSEERGDTLEVTNMQFSRPDLSLGTPASSAFSLARGDLMRIGEIAVLFITALIIVFMVVRPLVKTVIEPSQLALAGAGGSAGALGDGTAERTGLPAADGATLPEDDDEGETIDIEHIDGQVKASSVKKVAQLVEQHPEESMNILRSWLNES
ncbi:flagellar basal-body MS-ring/collar protein FliF [Woodsholea maritima]|uniref:flagellar basal-body MS-ring/collar protein FliF n=1 Tax=Woodsholea maritima TaxID=240237 RepID=UPI0003708BD3|nr:flagellar basal-body MS-ring/collar protein FliF [Woodsholea maritima]